MEKNIIGIGIALLLLGIGGFAIFKMNESDVQQSKIKQQGETIYQLSTQLDSSQSQITVLSELNTVYKDSIKVLNTKIALLEHTLSDKNATIRKLRGKLKRRDKRLKDKSQEIARLYRKAKLDKTAIARLEQEKKTIRNEMKLLKAQEKDVLVAKSATQTEIADYQKNVANMTLLTSLVESTNVQFFKIEGKKYKSGIKLKGMKKGIVSWNYIDFSFVLSHPEHRILLDKTFVLRLFDTEKNQAIDYVEKNQKHPVPKIGGIPFHFDGNKVEISFANSKVKTANNYEVRIYLKTEHEDIPLENGTLPVVVNGKFVQVR